ncbi:MAG: hypothetical protein JST67_01115 [Bacteroidetes bacterium]|nr:hypothetical protein [Bacteroidota bacterium]
MYKLSEQQIDFILDDIRRNGIEMEELQLNLLDHICCIIEQNLKDGDDFEGFYKKTVQKFYKNNLHEVEEETITLLTIKNYYVMKKTMITSGTLAVAAFVLGSFFKIMYWPGAAVLLLLAMVTLTFVFLPLLFFIKSKEPSNKKNKWLVAAAVLTGMLYATASLFSIMHWPGRTYLWLSTSAVSIFALIPIYFFTNIKNELNRTNTIVNTIILVGATGILFLQTSIRPGKAVELCNFYANEDLASTQNFLLESGTLMFKQMDTNAAPHLKKMTNLHQKSKNLCAQIEQLKINLVNAVDSRTDKEIHYATLYMGNFGGFVPSTRFLFDENHQPRESLLNLRKEAENYLAFIKKEFNVEGTGMLNTKESVEIDGDGTLFSWEIFNFYKVPFDVVVRNLTQLQIDVQIAEQRVFLMTAINKSSTKN